MLPPSTRVAVTKLEVFAGHAVVAVFCKGAVALRRIRNMG
jgi:hypothetical protein